jgi:hypothetical protein
MTGPAGPEDNVVRLRQFEASHLEITITSPGPGSLLWIARRDGMIIAADFWLGKLLDTLDWLDGQPGGAPS